MVVCMLIATFTCTPAGSGDLVHHNRVAAASGIVNETHDVVLDLAYRPVCKKVLAKFLT